MEAVVLEVLKGSGLLTWDVYMGDRKESLQDNL